MNKRSGKSRQLIHDAIMQSVVGDRILIVVPNRERAREAFEMLKSLAHATDQNVRKITKNTKISWPHTTRLTTMPPSPHGLKQ